MLDSIDRVLSQGATAAARTAAPSAVEETAPARPPRPEQEAARPPVRVLGVRLPHVHRYRYAGDDPFSAHSLYRCRCGVVTHGL